MKQIVDRTIQLIYIVLFRLMLCWWFISRPHCFSAYVAIRHQDKILIIKNSYKRLYTVPCGSIKKGEDALAGAIRETAEEIGIRLKADQLSLAYQFTIFHEYMHDHVSFFEVEFSEPPTIRIDNREVVWAEFLSATAARQLHLSPVVQRYLSR